jgi:hypothetical protein
LSCACSTFLPSGSLAVSPQANGTAPHQQPGGGETPGVAVAPVALAGAIVAGLARSIDMLSTQADVFGVGMTGAVCSRLVVTSCVTSGWSEPGGGLAGTSGVDSGRAAPLVGGPPGVELHTMVDAPPTGGADGMVPVVLPTNGVGMVPKARDDMVVVDAGIAGAPPIMDGETALDIVDGGGTYGTAMEGGGRAGVVGSGGAGMVVPGMSVMNDVAGCADSVRYGAIPLPVADGEEAAGTADIVGIAAADGNDPIVPPMADMDVTGTAGVPGAICPVGVEQVTTVPGVVGSEASGTGTRVVSGVPVWVVAENGLGPLSGEVTIAPGVVGRPMAVLPMVETCARQAEPPSSNMLVVNSTRRIASRLPSPACPDYVFRTATLSPSARFTIGLRTTSSPGLTPSCTSTSLPKSRAIVIFCRCTLPFRTTATCRPS